MTGMIGTTATIVMIETRKGVKETAHMVVRVDMLTRASPKLTLSLTTRAGAKK